MSGRAKPSSRAVSPTWQESPGWSPLSVGSPVDSPSVDPSDLSFDADLDEDGGKRGGGRSLRLPFLARDEKSRGQSAMEKQYRSDLNQCISELRLIVAPSESRGSQSAANATPPLNKVEVLQRACDFLRQSRAKAALFASFPPQSGYVDDGLADRVAEQEARLRSIGALIAQQQATIEQITTQMRSEALRVWSRPPSIRPLAPKSIVKEEYPI